MFQGFTPETIDFLWGIRMNNQRDWFQSHKEQYITALYQPMKDLGQDLFQPFLDRPGNILKVSRIYRDARLHHPDPYKESLWICIRQGVCQWSEAPCLYFEVNPEGVTYGFSLWKPHAAVMAEIRRDITAQPEEFLSLIHNTQAATDLPVTGDAYKRPKEAADPRLSPYLNWKGNISCARQEPVGPGLFGPELGARAAELFRQLIPLYDYYNRFPSSL